VDPPENPILHLGHTGLTEAARLVVRDSRAWDAVWKKAHEGYSEVPSLPAVDFPSEMVLVAAQGAQGSSGYDISIDRMVVRGDGMTVDVTSTAPDLSRCYVLAVITAPVMMVRVPSVRGRVEFKERERIQSCG
jgi:hypothetical protein